MLRILFFAACIAIFVPEHGFAQDSTGVHISSIPDHLPQREKTRLARQKKLLETAADSINAAIGRFNARCGGPLSPGGLAACQADMRELQGGGAELEQLKIRFNADVEATTARFPRPTAAVPDRPAIEDRGGPVPPKARKSAGIKGGGSAIDQARGAKAAGEKANASDEPDKGVAQSVFDTPGEPAPEGVTGGERKPLVVPKTLQKDPQFLKLDAQRIRLEKERRTLFTDLAKAQGNLEQIANIKKKLAKNDQDAAWIRYKQEEMINKRNR